MRDAGAGLAHRRVVAVDEGHGRDPIGRARRRATSSAAPAASSAIGFSQTTCLPASSAASASGRWRWFGVQTWTTSMRLGGDQLLGASAKPRSARSSVAAASRALGRGGGDAGDPAPGEPRGARVDAADEAGADDAGAQLRSRSRSVTLASSAAEPLSSIAANLSHFCCACQAKVRRSTHLKSRNWL